MKIGILGSGDAGKALALAFASEGHQVMIATRQPQSNKGVGLKGMEIEVGGFPETAQFCELAILCTPWARNREAIQLIEPKNLSGKVVIDVTNPLDFSQGMPPKLLPVDGMSGGEQIQLWLPHSQVVKAFNTVGNQHMYKPNFSDATPTMFYCGNDDRAKEIVRTIILAFGWDPLDVGDISSSRELESLCVLWVKAGMQTGNWNHAFKLLGDQD